MTEMKYVASFEDAKDAYVYLCDRTGSGTALTNGDWDGKYGPNIDACGSYYLGSSHFDGHGNDSYDSGNGHIKRDPDGMWQVFIPAPVTEPEWVLVNEYADVSTEYLSSFTYRVDDSPGYRDFFYIDRFTRNIGEDVRFDKVNHRYRIEDGRILVEKRNG